MELPQEGAGVSSEPTTVAPHKCNLSACFDLAEGGGAWLGRMNPPSLPPPPPPPETLSFCVLASFLVSGGFDRTVAIWDVGEGYRKLSLKVSMAVPGRGSGGVLGAGDTAAGETGLEAPTGADTSVQN